MEGAETPIFAQAEQPEGQEHIRRSPQQQEAQPYYAGRVEQVLSIFQVKGIPLEGLTSADKRFEETVKLGIRLSKQIDIVAQLRIQKLMAPSENPGFTAEDHLEVEKKLLDCQKRFSEFPTDASYAVERKQLERNIEFLKERKKRVEFFRVEQEITRRMQEIQAAKTKPDPHFSNRDYDVEQLTLNQLRNMFFRQTDSFLLPSYVDAALLLKELPFDKKVEKYASYIVWRNRWEEKKAKVLLLLLFLGLLFIDDEENTSE